MGCVPLRGEAGHHDVGGGSQCFILCNSWCETLPTAVICNALGSVPVSCGTVNATVNAPEDCVEVGDALGVFSGYQLRLFPFRTLGELTCHLVPKAFKVLRVR